MTGLKGSRASALIANLKEETRLTHVLYHFESPDVVNLRLDQLPYGVLLVPYPLVERGRVRHQVRPVLLQGIQSCKQRNKDASGKTRV